MEEDNVDSLDMDYELRQISELHLTDSAGRPQKREQRSSLEADSYSSPNMHFNSASLPSEGEYECVYASKGDHSLFTLIVNCPGVRVDTYDYRLRRWVNASDITRPYDIVLLMGEKFPMFASCSTLLPSQYRLVCRSVYMLHAASFCCVCALF